MPLLILFLLLPIAEIWLFILVGERIGAWQTVALVVLAAIAGSLLMRRQGLTVLGRAQAALAAGEFPAAALLDGLFVLIAGALLIIPGFLTDAVGLLLFITPLRRWIGAGLWSWVSHRPGFVVHRYGAGRYDGGKVVEGTYSEVRPDARPNGSGDSPRQLPPTEPGDDDRPRQR